MMDKATRLKMANDAANSTMDAIRTARSMGMLQTDLDFTKMLTTCFEVIIEETEKIALSGDQDKNKIIVDVPIV